MPLSIRFTAKLRIGTARKHLLSDPLYVLEVDEEFELLSIVPYDRKYGLILYAIQYGYLDEADTAYWHTESPLGSLSDEGKDRLLRFIRTQLKFELMSPLLQEGAEFRLIMMMHDNKLRTIDYEGQVTKTGYIEIEKVPSSDLASR